MNFEGFSDSYILLFLPIIVALALIYILRPTTRRWLSTSPLCFYTRLFALLALSIVLAGPYRDLAHEESDAVVLLDISDSMNNEVAQSLLERVDVFAQEGVQFDLIPFAKEAAATSVPFENANRFRSLQDAWGRLNIGGSNLEAGLDAILGHRPGSVVLVSDGQQTSGNATNALSLLSSAGFKVFPMLPSVEEQSMNQAFSITQLSAPLVAAAKKSVDIRTSVKNSGVKEQRGVLEIRHDDKVVYSETIAVPAGEELVKLAQSDPSSEGIKEITATLRPSDSSIAPSSETIYVSGQLREKVLLLSGSSDDSRLLKEVLENQAYQLRTEQGDLRTVNAIELSDFSAVILNNIAREQLPTSLPASIESYVRSGGGLIMLGGNRSFGLGGYQDSAIEKALPVTILPPETIKKRLNIAVELVIDKSRSMADGEKLDFAKEAARETIRNLKDDDYIGVVGFDASPFVVVELDQLSRSRQKALDLVGRLFSAGRTNMIPAIDEARRSLVRVNAGRKHMIILTDGKIPDEGPFYLELVKEMRLMGITVSTVLMGSDASPGMLKTMADQGGGAFYQTQDARNLPKIFLTDLKVGSGEKTLKEESEYLVRKGPGEIISTSIQNFPPIRGYVQTKRKDGGNVELIAYGYDKADPLLASWGYGKGKSVAFTSDASGRWSNIWVSWPRFGTFWSEVVDWVRKRSDIDESVRFDLRYSVENGALLLDLSIFSETAPTNVQGILKLPSGEERKIDLGTISTGHYQSRLMDATAGRYEFRALVDRAKLTPVAFNLPGSLFGEQKGRGFNTPLLYSIAARTSGKVNPSLADLKGQVYTRHEKQSLSWIFLAAALFLILSEILERELHLLTRCCRVFKQTAK